VDTVGLADGDRVGVIAQTDGRENGIYQRKSATLWERAVDFTDEATVEAGVEFYTQEGATNGGKTFLLTTTGDIDVGTTDLTFTDNSGGPPPPGEDLAATLVLGNITGGTDIEVTSGDSIHGEDAAGGSGNPGGALVLRGGTGDGAGVDGAVVLDWGSDGAVQADTGGDARGTGALDLQKTRTASAQVASGDYALLLGQGSTASGNYAFAQGRNTRAQGNYDLSRGWYNASYDSPYAGSISNQFVTGLFSSARGAYGSMALGTGVQVGYLFGSATVYRMYGESAFAFGSYSRAFGDRSVAMGNSASAYGFSSVALGYRVKAGTPFTVGTDDWNTFQASWDYYRNGANTPYGGDTFFWNSRAAMAINSQTYAQAPASLASGIKSATTFPGEWAQGGGRPGARQGSNIFGKFGAGSAQSSRITMLAHTTTSTAVLMEANNGRQSSAPAHYYVIPQNKAVGFRVQVVAIGQTNAPPLDRAAFWEFTGLVRRAAAIQAKGTIQVIAVGSVGDTITVGGRTLTAANSRTPGNLDFDISSGVLSTISQSLNSAFNDPQNGFRTPNAILSRNSFFSGLLGPGSVGAILWAYPEGTAGNAVTLATSNPAAYSLSGATLTGGVDSVLTLVGVSAAGPTAPTYSDAFAAGYTAEVKIDATKQSLDIEVATGVGSDVSWTATIDITQSGMTPALQPV
jgi:hypothetical protein